MLDQEKTGKFIAEVRRQKGVTQKELAEKLGISDKTISKWETGHGMPDVSVMSELCRELAISANELLAGERLESIESFNRKAEENIMELMKDNKKANQKSRWSLFGGTVGLLLLFLYIMGGIQGTGITLFLDLPSACCVLGITTLVLVASGKLYSFFRGIKLCLKKPDLDVQRADEERRDKEAGAEALSTAMTANILGAVFGSITGLVYVLVDHPALELILPSVAVALLTIFYAIIFNLILLPFRERLKG